MNSIQITIEATEEQQEILISQLSDLNADGFEETEKNIIAYFNEANFNSSEINEIIKNYSFTVNTIEERNWNEVWEHNFQPVIIENFCTIRAEFHQPIANVKYEILITPKMSFGTGHHATTYMMIEQMSEMNFAEKTVFDFGTGTGILGILAEKTGAAEISATDIDDWSIENAKENIDKNNCSKISVYLSSQIPSRKFDIILANINRNVILDYLPELHKALSLNGQLLLSGFLVEDEAEIIKKCNQLNFHFIRKIKRMNWISLLLAKPVQD